MSEVSDHPFRPHMLHAVRLAAEARWRTAPNPAVGAVLVKDGVIVAEGRHNGPGLAHAEVEALRDAAGKGVNPTDCSMVVTLEPCVHHGKTPPCADAILAAGIRHLVVGMTDPNPEAAGGIDYLRAKGLTVDSGVAEQECYDLIEDFIVWQTMRQPYVLLKLASTLDGRIATRTGHSKWISGPESRHQVHALRRYMQALIVGGNTFYQDDPELTCRMDETVGMEQPLAVVATSRLPDAGAAYRLLNERPECTVFWTTVAAAASPKAEALRRKGVRVIGLPSHPRATGRGHGMRAELDLAEGLAHLHGELGCHYAMCEGGGRLGLSLLDKGLARELHLHMAPKILGDNEATALFDGHAPLLMEEALQLRITEAHSSGADIMLTLRQQKRPEARAVEAV